MLLGRTLLGASGWAWSVGGAGDYPSWRSGGFGPTVGGPVAMGYVEKAHAAPGTPVTLLIRGKTQPAEVVSLPFVTQNYKR